MSVDNQGCCSVTETGAGMELNHLVVLDSQVVSSPLQVSHLHEEAGAERLPDVQVVILAGEVRASSLQVEPVHNPAELLPHVVGRLQ